MKVDQGLLNGLLKCGGMVEGDIVPDLIQGSTGKVYHGREVVVYLHKPGLFGTRSEHKPKMKLATLHNGLLNQCSLLENEGKPSPYWAVLDAAIDLKSGFTRKDVIDKAVHRVGEDSRKACEMAWDVLRNHHRHERKREAGMAYMFDTLTGGKLAIRARSGEETLQYFRSEADRKAQSRNTMKEVEEVRAEAEVPSGVE